jgi:sugar diacid utilization regulator
MSNRHLLEDLPHADEAQVHDVMHRLIDLLEAQGDGDDATEAPVLRRIVQGRQRRGDDARLASRFASSHLCVVLAPRTHLDLLANDLSAVAGTLAFSTENALVVLVAGLPRQVTCDPRERVARVVARVHRIAPTATVGVSGVLDAPHEAPRGMDEARRAADLCAPGRVVLADDVWVQIALSRMRDSLRASLAVEGPLTRLDDALRSGADLRSTLTTWLEVDGDIRLAAARLHLHPNTLRYRLRRAAEVTGLDLDDPLQRLVVHLALTS